jgi:hypothetical protein
MKRNKFYAYFSLIIILAFMGYIIYDSVNPGKDNAASPVRKETTDQPSDKWKIQNEIFIRAGLKAVAVSKNGDVFLGGESFVSCYNKDLEEKWTLEMSEKITAVSVYGDTVYATSRESVFLLDKNGEIIGDWGPYEADCLITSVSSNKHYVAVADAANKIVFIIRKDGEVASMIGHFGEKLHIPSPYFDVSLTADDKLMMANTGMFRIETRALDGKILSTFGVSGMGNDGFCGCCNPAHFSIIPQGYITAEKGLNRIKILDSDGYFVEFVSSVNNFTASVPLDITSADGKTIYGANPFDSKLYVFKRAGQ